MNTENSVPAPDRIIATPPPGSFQSFDNALRVIARDKSFRLDLIDHRGRRFIKDFFVAGGGEGFSRLVVWGWSASGASKVVAWSPGRSRRHGRRVRMGWGNAKNAQSVADSLNAAAAAWCAQHGRLPTKPKRKAKKKRK